jgi:hypothetical protein
MILPNASNNYDQGVESQRNLLIEQADDMNRKKNQDIELRNDRLILQSPNGTRFKLAVENNGNLSAVQI